MKKQLHNYLRVLFMLLCIAGAGDASAQASGIITTIAGNGTPGYTGDGGPAPAVELNLPYGVAVDGSGNIYISDQNNYIIRKINTSGIMTTIAGNGTNGYTGDGGPATAAQIGNPQGVAVDGSGNLYIADVYNYVIRKVNTAGIISTFAGNNALTGALMPGSPTTGDGGQATAATLISPTGVAVDASGNVYIADQNDSRVRMVNISGIITNFAGNGSPGFGGDGGAAWGSQLNNPTGVAVDGIGNVYIADNGINDIRKVNTSGIISTIAGGNGPTGYGGDGGPATLALLSSPRGVAVDGSGNVYIADQNNNVIRVVNSSGIINNYAGNGITGFAGDGYTATTAELSGPTGVAVDGSGNVYVADNINNVIRKISTSAVPSATITGTTTIVLGSFVTLSVTGTANAAITLLPYGAFTLNGSGIATYTVSPATTTTYSIALVYLGGSWQAGSGSAVVTVAAPTATLTGTASICAGSVATLSVTGTANAGITLYPSGTFTLSGSGLATYTVSPASTTTYNIAVVSVGSSTAVGTGSAVVTVVNPLPTPTVTGASTLCIGATTAFISTGTGGGIWISTAPGIASVDASGNVTGLSAGSATIYYHVSNTCGIQVGSAATTVSPVLSAGSISGATSLCVGSTTGLTASGSAGGTWFSNALGIATVDASGNVTGVSAGSATIYYRVLNTCDTSIATYVMTIVPVSTPTITGATSICTGSTATYSATGTGGTWSTTSATIATVSATGVVTALAAGVNTVVYTNTNACGTVSGQKVFTVNTTPVAVTISGTRSLCPATMATLTASVAGGTWVSRSVMVATITPAGVVTGLTAGTDIISYTLPANSCGAAVTSTVTLTVNPNPSAGVLSGVTGVCTAGTGTVTSTVSGGVWSSGTPSLATVSSNTITGVSAGTDVLSYTVTNLGCSSSVTKTITITGNPTVGTISFPSTMCVGSTASISCTPAGGTWSVSASAILAIGAPCHAYAVGVATVFYTVVNTCHSSVSALAVTVITTPTVSAIAGNSPLCTSSTLNLTDATSGGTWLSNNPAVATVSGGVVSPVTTGTAVIVYSVTNACGSASVATTVTVTATPVAATISGTNTLCTSGTATLTASLTGGTWASGASGIVTVSATGAIRGITGGTGLISYTMPGNTCGSAQTATVSVTVISGAGTISGMTTICNGTSTLFTESISGGTWSSSNTLVASVSGTGSVTAVGVGSASIIYSVTGTCGSFSSSYSVTVIPTPVAATISGVTSMCAGGNATLTASVAGGVWGSGTPAVATINSVTAAVHALTIGTDVIAYTLPATSCSSALTSTYTVTVISNVAGTIIGATTVCQNATTVYTVTGAGGAGIWTTANGNSSVTATGLTTGAVTGRAAGTSTVVFTVSNACGTNHVTKAITVNGLPTVAPITIGATTLCKGVTTPISDATLGGHWTVSDATILLLGSPLRAGSVAGTAFLNYAITNTCGVITTSVAVTVTSCPGAARDIEGSSTTVENTTSDVVKVFPNPSTGMLFIEATMKVDAKLSSIDGRLLIDQKDVTELDMNNLANGIYFINVYDSATGLLVKTDRVVKN